MPKVTSKGKSDSNETQLAINLWDCDHINPLLRPYLLGGRLDKDNAVWVDKSRVDETALVFTCELLEAALVIDIVRNEQRKKGEPPIRAYIHKRTWTRLTGTQVLTVTEDGKAALNSEIFAPEEEIADLLPPPFETIIIGKS